MARRYLGELRTEVTGDAPLFSADLGIQRTLPGGKVIPGKRTLYFGSMAIYRGRGDLEMLARIAAFVRNLGTERTDEFIRVRAGAVTVGGRAVLLPEPEDPRLAGFVASLVRAGGSYVADDVARIEPVLRRIHPIPLPMLVDTEDLSRFPELDRPVQRRRRQGLTELARQAMHRQPVSPDELGTGAQEPVEIGWIVFPRFVGDGADELQPAGGAQALFRFAETRLNLHVWGERALVFMRHLLEETPVSWLSVADADRAARVVLDAAPSMVEAPS
jgi:hypothetical protein